MKEERTQMGYRLGGGGGGGVSIFGKEGFGRGSFSKGSKLGGAGGGGGIKVLFSTGFTFELVSF
jgi:hypothetical protein